MTRIPAMLLMLAAGTVAQAQQQPSQGPAPQMQKGIGAIGTMYDGNTLIRLPLERPPSANPASPAAATPGVTGAQGSRDESGSGARGGEH